MKISNNIFIALIFSILCGCGVPQADYDNCKTENERLKLELDECMYGASKIIAEVEKAYSNKDYSLAIHNIKLLYEKHPESSKNAEFKTLSKTIEKIQLKEKERKEAQEKERIKLENLNNTGMWSVGYYVDSFGESTNDGYIINTKPISGTFSNTATQDSKLNVDFLISNSSNISIQLYEYARNNPVKENYSTRQYIVLAKDKDGNELDLNAGNSSDRLKFNKLDSRQIHNAFMKGGNLKFVIWELENSTTKYKFSIQNADWYDNAYRKLVKN